MSCDSVKTETVLIFVYFPGQWILKASVLESASTKDLEQFMPEKEISFIYNGIILNSNLPFSFYGVKTHDIIICVRTKEINAQWLSLTNRELINQRVSEVVDPRVSYEMAKLRDYQMLRIDRKPKLFRKMCMQLNDEIETTAPSIPLEIPSRSLKPSVSPLPSFWSSSLLLNTVELSSSPDPTIETVRSNVTASVGTE